MLASEARTIASMPSANALVSASLESRATSFGNPVSYSLPARVVVQRFSEFFGAVVLDFVTRMRLNAVNDDYADAARRLNHVIFAGYSLLGGFSFTIASIPYIATALR
jgi:hypothetical protein